MSTIEVADGSHELHSKGAPEVILEKCTHYQDAEGSVVPLNKQIKNQINRVVRDMARRGLRTIALSSRTLSSEESQRFEKAGWDTFFDDSKDSMEVAERDM